MLPIGTKVRRTHLPNIGQVGTTAREMISGVRTYLIVFDTGMSQYWSPDYFEVVENQEPDWEI